MPLTRNIGLLLTALAALGVGGTPPAQASAVVITGASSGSPATDLTAVGTTDWTKWGFGTNITTFINKSSTGVAGGAPVGDISNLTPVADVVPGGPSAPYTQLDYGSAAQGNPTLSWTDGSDSTYTQAQANSDDSDQHNANFYNVSRAGIGMGWTFTVNVPALSTGTFYLYEEGYNSTDTLSATSADGTPSSSLTYDNASGAPSYFTAAIDNALPTADTLNFTFYESASDGEYDNPKIQASALSLTQISAAPEPSAAVLLGLPVLGLGGLLLKARRRASAATPTY